MKKSLTITAIALFAFFGILFGFHFGMQHIITGAIKKAKPPLAVVSSTIAKSVKWRPFIESTGQLKAVQGVSLLSEAPGIIDKIEAKSGQMVKKGEIILSLRHGVESAQLQGAKATLLNDLLDYTRIKKVFDENKLISEQALDTARVKVDADKAQVAQIEAQINQKILRAPFSGKLGIINVRIGQYITSQATVVSLQTQAPIHINFSLPESDVAKINLKQGVEFNSEAYPGVVFKGKVTAIDNEINEKTKSLAVQATAGNTNFKHLLIPGMFVTVKTLLAQQKNIVTIPQTAINYTLYGNSIYKVITATKKTPKHVKLVYIQLGDKYGDLVAIKKGVSAGERIVTAGQMKLHDGSLIK